MLHENHQEPDRSRNQEDFWSSGNLWNYIVERRWEELGRKT